MSSPVQETSLKINLEPIPEREPTPSPALSATGNQNEVQGETAHLRAICPVIRVPTPIPPEEGTALKPPRHRRLVSRVAKDNTLIGAAKEKKSAFKALFIEPQEEK